MKSIPYTKDIVLGKHVVSLHMGMWKVHKIVHIGYNDNNEAISSGADKVSEHLTRDEALKEAAKLNDWQYWKDTVVYRAGKHSRFGQAYNVEPWEHLIIFEGKVYFFIWDTREITKVAKAANIDMSDYLIKAQDSRKPLAKNGKWLSLSELRALPTDYKTPKEQNKA